MWVSTGHTVFHWFFFVVNLLFLLFGIYRLISTILIRRKKILYSISTGRGSARIARESHLLLTMNGIIFFTFMLMGVSERMYNTGWTVMTFLFWGVTFLTFTAFHISWSKVVYRVVHDTKYKVLAIVAAVNVSIATVVIVGIVLALTIPSLYSATFDTFRILLYAGVPLLFIVQDGYFIYLAIQFLRVVLEQRISFGMVRKLQQMTLIGFALLVGNILGCVSTVIFITTYTVGGYYSSIALLNVAGWIFQGGSFLVPGNIDAEEQDTTLDTQSEEYAWTPSSQLGSDQAPSTVMAARSNDFYLNPPSPVFAVQQTAESSGATLTVVCNDVK
jgi:hypothetical protein